MVAARSAAMGFNRLVDARLDALNPRTAGRELPRGAMTPFEAVVFVAVSSALFVFAAWRLNPICFWLSPVALAIVFWYSLAKRFTTWTQLFLGLAMAVAPVGGWLAVGGRGGWEPWLLALAIGTWVGGFDVLYACQDLDFDRAHGLRSIPVRFGVRASLLISRVMHVGHGPVSAGPVVGHAAVAVLLRRRCRRGAASRVRAVARPGGRSVAGEESFRHEWIRRHLLLPRAGGVRLCPLRRPAAPFRCDNRQSQSRSPARAGRSTRRARWRRSCRAASTSRWSISDYGRRLLHDELGDEATVEQLMPFLSGKYGADVSAGRSPCTATATWARRSRAAATAASAWRSCRAR